MIVEATCVVSACVQHAGIEAILALAVLASVGTSIAQGAGAFDPKTPDANKASRFANAQADLARRRKGFGSTVVAPPQLGGGQVQTGAATTLGAK